MGKNAFWRRAANPAKNNAWTRASKAYSSGMKAVKGDGSDDAATDDAARSEAATNQNQNRQRQGGSAQIDYYGTENATT